MAGKNGTTQAAGQADAAPIDEPSRDFKVERKLYLVQSDGPGGRTDQQPQPGRRRGMIDRSQQAQLGKLLRAVYSDVADDPVPDRFVHLIDALAAREKKS